MYDASAITKLKRVLSATMVDFSIHAKGGLCNIFSGVPFTQKTGIYELVFLALTCQCTVDVKYVVVM